MLRLALCHILLEEVEGHLKRKIFVKAGIWTILSIAHLVSDFLFKNGNPENLIQLRK